MKQPFDDVEIRGKISLTGNRNLNGCLILIRNQDGSITETTIDSNTLKIDETTGKLTVIGGGGGVSANRGKTITTDYTLSNADDNYTIGVNNSSNVTVTIPNGLKSGMVVRFIQMGSGTITFAAGGTATVTNIEGLLKSRGLYAECGVSTPDGNLFIVSGDLTN